MSVGAREMPGGVPVEPRAADSGGRLHPWPAITRESLWVTTAVIVIILFRSALFVFREHLAFDSDQAVIGLMAKHLMEGRAFPLFMYGENYVLGVQAWMAAPVFFVTGVSVAGLKLPLLVINFAVGLLLVRLLVREAGLRPAAAFVAGLFFLLPAPGTSAALLEASGGNLEPFLYVLLLWLTRRRPGWFGFIFAVGFLQRGFTVYALLAVVVIELASGAWRSSEDRRRSLAALRVAAEVWLVVQWLRQFSSAAGPGTTMADLNVPSNNVLEVLHRVCVDPRMFLSGGERLVRVHWPGLFGTSALRLSDFGLESAIRQGAPGLGLLLAFAIMMLLARIVMRARADGASWRRHQFCAYLTLVGAMSAAVYALGRCGVVEITTMRYDLLSILGAVGVAGLFLALETNRWIRRLGGALIVAWAIGMAVPHARLWAEYVSHPPVAAKELIIRQLQARGIRYVITDYWIAYYVTFLTNEQIIAAAVEVPRILAYTRQVHDHPEEAVRVSRRPCGDGKPAVAGVFFCPP